MRFKVRPVEIEAFQFFYLVLGDPSWFLNSDLRRINEKSDPKSWLEVKTKNGWVKVNDGDFIIKGNDEFYPCAPDVFRKKYKPVTP